ncbi:hypothetical protein Tco_0083665 [Tanacetum coccineum]
MSRSPSTQDYGLRQQNSDCIVTIQSAIALLLKLVFNTLQAPPSTLISVTTSSKSSDLMDARGESDGCNSSQDDIRICNTHSCLRTGPLVEVDFHTSSDLYDGFRSRMETAYSQQFILIDLMAHLRFIEENTSKSRKVRYFSKVLSMLTFAITEGVTF